MTTFRRSAPALLALLAGAPLAAQVADPLGEHVRAALEANPGLRQERLEARAAASAVREAAGALLPSVTLDARYSRASGGFDLGELVNPAYRALNELTGSQAFPTDLDARLPLAHETRLRVAQPLFAPAALENRRLRGALHDLREEGAGAAARALAAAAQRAYLDYARAVRVEELHRETLPLLEEGVRVAERLVDRGVATPDLVLRARADRAETSQRLLEAGDLARAALGRFNLLLDRPLDAPVELVPDTLLVRALPVDEEEAVVRALAGREELRQGDAAVAAARSGERLARALAMPTVLVALDYGFQGREPLPRSDEDFAAASLVVQWTPVAGGQHGARREAARLDAERARTRRHELQRLVELDARTAHRAAATALASIPAAEERLAAARRSWELVERRWQEGMVPGIQLLDARTAFVSAGLNLILTRYACAAALVELERAAALRDLPR
jgi:outer membrane protein TolC